MTTLASVVVTNRDYARYLGEAVDSALAQPATEVVVVDDGSVDDSLAVLAGYGDRVRVCTLTGRGQAAALNAGFAVSTGDPVLFLDADDRLAPGIVDRVRSLLVGDVARVHFPLRRIDGAGRATGGTVPDDPDRLPDGDLRRQVLTHLHDLCWAPTTGNAYRRSVLDRILPAPEEPYRIGADHYLNGLSALYGPIRRVATVGGDYRVHDVNADARTSFDLSRLQDIVARSVETGRLVRAAAHADGQLDEPAGRRDSVVAGSVSLAANRVVSMRLGRTAHPITGDRVGSAWVDGVRAAVGRDDLSPVRRVAAAGLVSVLAVAPTSTLPRLAHRFLVGATDRPSRRRRRSGTIGHRRSKVEVTAT